jgi:hypothetical protein
MAQSIKEIFGYSMKEYDLLGKDEPYKMELTTTRRSHSKYFIFNNTFMGNVMNTVENIILPKAKGFAGVANLFTAR